MKACLKWLKTFPPPEGLKALFALDFPTHVTKPKSTFLNETIKSLKVP